MKEIKGNLISLAKSGNFDIIMHGCNCFCKMESGIARHIRQNFPEAWEADQFTITGDITKLGNYTLASVKVGDRDLIIINAYTQFKYGRDKVHVDYEALTLCMRKINYNFPGKKIGIPRIGAGLAGGDWNRIRDIIKSEMTNVNITACLYK